MRCTGTVWEGDSFALEFSDQALLEDQLLVTPNDETICLSRILGSPQRPCAHGKGLPLVCGSARTDRIGWWPDSAKFHGDLVNAPMSPEETYIGW
jgi:hypothetical protein